MFFGYQDYDDVFDNFNFVESNNNNDDDPRINKFNNMLKNLNNNNHQQQETTKQRKDFGKKSTKKKVNNKKKVLISSSSSNDNKISLTQKKYTTLSSSTIPDFNAEVKQKKEEKEKKLASLSTIIAPRGKRATKAFVSSIEKWEVSKTSFLEFKAMELSYWLKKIISCFCSAVKKAATKTFGFGVRTLSLSPGPYVWKEILFPFLSSFGIASEDTTFSSVLIVKRCFLEDLIRTFNVGNPYEVTKSYYVSNKLDINNITLEDVKEQIESIYRIKVCIHSPIVFRMKRKILKVHFNIHYSLDEGKSWNLK